MTTCDGVPICPDFYNQVNSCDSGGDCFEVTECGATIYCAYDEWRCEVPPPVCEPDEEEVQSCEGRGDDCYALLEDTECYGSIYCDPIEELCEAIPECQEGEVEVIGCVDDGSRCRSETLCGVTISCSPAEDVQVTACSDELMLPADPFDLEMVHIEGDELVLTVSYSGGCAFHLFPACFGGFMESSPVQVSVALGHDAQDDLCEAYPTEDRRLSLGALKQAYQDAYGEASGSMILNIAGAPEALEYSF